MAFPDGGDQVLNVGRTAAAVDVEAVGLIGQNGHIGVETLQHPFRRYAGGAVGAVNDDVIAVQVAGEMGLQETEILLKSFLVAVCLADGLTGQKLQLAVTVDVVLNGGFQSGVDLHAFAVDDLDAVVVIGIVRGGDHDAAAELLVSDQVDQLRRRADAQQPGIGAQGGNAGGKRAFKHTAGKAGIPSDQDAAAAEILAQILADAVSHVDGKILIGAASDAVRTEMYSHLTAPLLRSRLQCTSCRRRSRTSPDCWFRRRPAVPAADRRRRWPGRC